MNKTKKWAFAVLVVCGMSGCASMRNAEPVRADAMPAADVQVLRALPSYGSYGGYRYRRFVAVAATS